MSLDDGKLFYVHSFKISKEMCYTHEMIYRVFPSIEQEEMNTRGEEDEDVILKCFSNFRNI